MSELIELPIEDRASIALKATETGKASRHFGYE